MSDLYQAIRAAVRSLAGQHVGDRVRPDVLTTSDSLPAVAYQVTGYTPSPLLSGDGGDTYELLLLVVAATRTQAATVAAALQGLDSLKQDDFTFVFNERRDGVETQLDTGTPVFTVEVVARAYRD